jgi:Tol biopolymer transport system component
LAVGVAVGAVWAPWRSPVTVAEPVRFEITPRMTLAASGASAISPNGRHLAFIGSGPDGVLRVWVRDMDSLVDRTLPGSEVGQAAPPPFWSPDSRFIAFDAGGKLKKVDVSGGLSQTVCDLPTAAVGGSWNRDGVIIFGNPGGGILRVPEAGGTPSPITVVDPSRSENNHLTPVFLPDGRHFLYLRTSWSVPERTGIFIGSLDATPEQQDGRRLLATTTSVVYVPPSGGSGKLLFLRDGNLMAQAFDDRRLELSGVPALVAERVDSYLDTATVSASDTGVLVYRGAADLQLTWLDRQGRVVGRVREPGLYQTLNLSPDGAHAVVSKVSSQVSSKADLWLFDFARETNTRLTTANAADAVWSPDGSRIVFGSESGGVLYEKLTRGTQRQDVLYRLGENRVSPTSWSRDGRFLMYTAVDPKTSSDLWVLSLDGQSKAAPFLRTVSAESQGQFSPGLQRGHLWVAYTSNESGRNDVVVRTFPDAANQEVVSRSGGHSPRWRGDGRELFYVAADGTIIAVAFADGPPHVGPPTPLFQVPRGFASRDSTGSRAAAPWDVTPDGQRFLFAAPAEAGGLTHFTVVLNWQAGLTK